jgi:hypothetical protein
VNCVLSIAATLLTSVKPGFVTLHAMLLPSRAITAIEDIKV